MYGGLWGESIRKINTVQVLSKEKVIKCRNAVYKFFLLYYNNHMDEQTSPTYENRGAR